MKVRLTLNIMAALAVWISLGVPASAQSVDPPYQAKLERLSEILGSVHFLRNLCGAATPVWREKMDALLTAEKAEAERRARLVAHFNRGYRAFSSTYVKCTPSANLALSNYIREGEGLTKEVVLRYGN
jgi:uncharacterized protein (TIGR02301 family)